MRKIWSGEVVEHQSEFINWSGFKSYPLPVQNPFPVVMGGVQGKIFHRIAKYGNGWFAPEGNPETLAGHLKSLQVACDEHDRSMGDIEITCMWNGKGGRESIEALEAVGVHRVVVPLAGAASPVEHLKSIAEVAIG